MKKILYVSALIQVLVLQVATAQIIPVEIDLSRQEPSYPFLPPDMPKQVTNLDQVQVIGPVSVLTEEGEYVSGNIKLLRGSMDSLITRINVQDADSGETVKLTLDDIKSLIISTSVGVALNRVINQHRAVTYTGDNDLRNVGVIFEQVAYFEKVTLSKGNKEKSYLLQVVNPNCFGCNAVTLFFDTKIRNTQAKVNLDISEEGYRFKGVVSEFVPTAYYVRNTESNQVVQISEKTYKRSNGEYPSEIFTDQDLVRRLKEGNEASVSKYNEGNWAFFLPNAINYNKELLGDSIEPH